MSDPGSPAELRKLLVEFGQRFHQTAPVNLLDAARTMLVELDEWGVPLAPRPEPPPPPPPAKETPAPAPMIRLGEGPDPRQPGATTIVARDEQSEPVARTLRAILDLIGRKPLGSAAQAALEFAAHIEALELENRDLRNQLEAQRAVR